MRICIPTVSSFLLLAATVLLPATLSGCGENDVMADGDADASVVVRVETIEVPAVTLTETVEAAGSVEGFETADLYAKIGGYVGRMNVDIGDVVKGRKDDGTAADVLAVLHVPEMTEKLFQKKAEKDQAEAAHRRAAAALAEAKSQVVSARAVLEEASAQQKEKQALVQKAEADFKRMTDLGDAVRRELVDAARYELEAAKAGVTTAMARVASASAKVDAAVAHQTTVAEDQQIAAAAVVVADASLKYAGELANYRTIVAPFDGAVTKRMVDPGDFVQSADGNSAARPLLQVARLDWVRVRFDVPMNRAALLNTGDRVVFDRITALPGASFSGENVVVSRVSAGPDSKSRMLRAEVDIPNTDGKLRPGYYGYVTVTLAALENTPVVPSSALVVSGDEKSVFVVEDGKVKKRTITTNYEDGSVVGIASGLKAGETIVRAGGGQLSDGQEIDAKSGTWDAEK